MKPAWMLSRHEFYYFSLRGKKKERKKDIQHFKEVLIMQNEHRKSQKTNTSHPTRSVSSTTAFSLQDCVPYPAWRNARHHERGTLWGKKNITILTLTMHIEQRYAPGSLKLAHAHARFPSGCPVQCWILCCAEKPRLSYLFTFTRMPELDLGSFLNSSTLHWSAEMPALENEV